MTGPQSEGEEDTRQHELVIIRRRNDGEEAPHKGGVWKIAHADFMTALMAFFLVMWLITATDDKTITGVANYFNPMRLTDSTARPKGLFTMEPGGEHEDSEHGLPETDKPRGSSAGKVSERKAEAALFNDPYEALDRIAEQAGKTAPELAVTERGNTPAHKTGEAFRDPFDPDTRYELSRQGRAGGQTGEKEDASAPGRKSEGDSGPSSSQPATGHDDSMGAITELRRQIEETVRRSGFSAIPGIDVRSTDDGPLISITDQPNFEMFGIASARPEPGLVVLMEKIGKIIAGRPEQIVIRGHTDGRPFRSDDYDNWRLSTARAHMAYYMLVRSGLSEARVDRIEGHADHDLKIVDRPLAAENRRIEVLLLKGKP
ncbi:MAG: OmpA family protein [Hyphomicrobium sp.]|uniref:flagellar motor protein MotB n=1 Tax=Hyphomicrobium sp. TaxID=82 RepID=UPI0025B7E37C|nr:flagellar motor protein MotB [Hyphomicrobium sp.]MBZ0210124.1 OmpA family protein [Hyphomicrobium sp.]